jgi:hypothetical protein
MVEPRKEPAGDSFDQRLSRLLDTLEEKPKRSAESRVGYIEKNYDKLIAAVTKKNWTYKDLCSAMNAEGIPIKLSTFKRTMLRIKRQREATSGSSVGASRGDARRTSAGQKDAATKNGPSPRRKASAGSAKSDLAARSMSLISP